MIGCRPVWHFHLGKAFALVVGILRMLIRIMVILCWIRYELNGFKYIVVSTIMALRSFLFAV